MLIQQIRSYCIYKICLNIISERLKKRRNCLSISSAHICTLFLASSTAFITHSFTMSLGYSILQLAGHILVGHNQEIVESTMRLGNFMGVLDAFGFDFFILITLNGANLDPFQCRLFITVLMFHFKISRRWLGNWSKQHAVHVGRQLWVHRSKYTYASCIKNKH